tara:strand:- start:815 stop:1135 length:321 start_codon:yes stop_codon:yes gene_type:complete
MPGITFFPLNDVPYLSLLFNFYGYYLPIFLYAAWTPLALYDVGESKYSSTFFKFIWTLIILLIPLIGAFIYHVFVAQNLNVVVRATMIFGGITTFLIVFFYLALVL